MDRNLNWGHQNWLSDFLDLWANFWLYSLFFIRIVVLRFKAKLAQNLVYWYIILRIFNVIIMCRHRLTLWILLSLFCNQWLDNGVLLVGGNFQEFLWKYGTCIFFKIIHCTFRLVLCFFNDVDCHSKGKENHENENE